MSSYRGFMGLSESEQEAVKNELSEDFALLVGLAHFGLVAMAEKSGEVYEGTQEDLLGVTMDSVTRFSELMLAVSLEALREAQGNV